MGVFFGVDSLPTFKNSVVTIGTFDGVHKGHQEILAKVKRAANDMDGTSILITFEPHPRKLLYPQQSLKLLTPLEDKIELLQAQGIDHIIVAPFTKEFADLSAEDYITDFLVNYFNPKRIVIGYDHRFGHDRSGNISLLQSVQQKFGYEVEEIPAQLIDEAAVSSTKIRNALLEGEVKTAAQMLGRNFVLTGIVVEGAQLGRTIGYPTANIQPLSDDQLIPANGVYAVMVEVDSKQYPAMLNIGYKPTVTQEKKLTIEAHIFDFNADIYEKSISLIFVERLRDEQRFPSLDALKSQLAEDERSAKEILAAN